jgi:hypothetical protein
MADGKSKYDELKLMKGGGTSVTLDTYNISDEFKKLRESLNDRKYTVKETSISYRVINHWGSNNILPEGVRDDSGWRKFNLIEIIWLHAVTQMRNFGLSLKKINVVRNSVMTWDARSDEYSSVEFFIAEMTFSPTDPYIIIFGDGHVMIARSEQIEQQKIIYGSQHMLLISLKAILKQTELSNAIKDELNALLLLSQGERDVLEKLRSEDNSEMRTRIRNGSIFENETSTIVPGTTSSNDVIKEMRTKGTYGQVIVNIEDGIEQSIKKVKRKRFPK